ncbi:MAG: DUF4215 domain-containing protein [Deltaproteobacteria bacterium]|nr:DUF4215 domain-containing protein [Deltaproteobacteria bacterium]
MTHSFTRAIVRLGLAALAIGIAAPAMATPIERHASTRRGGVVTTGNTLGLAGTTAGPSTADRIGVFTDATLTLQEPGWPLGTTDDWRLGSSDAVLDLPAGATVVYAELVWGASFDAGVIGDLDDAVSFRTPSGTVHDVAPDAATAPALDGSMGDNDYYARSADVTSLIEGPGIYRVGRVPATVDDGDSAAGWALHVVYTKVDLPYRRVAIFTIMESVSSVSASAVTASVAGVCIPESAAARDARLAVVTMEGDADISGETVRLERSESRLANNDARLLGVGTTITNPLGGHITQGDGTIDTRGTFGSANNTGGAIVAGARQGFDVITFDGTDHLDGQSTSALFRTTAGSDQHLFLSGALQVDMRTPDLGAGAGAVTVDPAIASIGDVITVTVRLDNTGDATANNIVFRLTAALPAGISYVANSFESNGAAPLGGPVPSAAELTSGIGIANVAAGTSAVITFELRVDAATAGPSLAIAPVVTYTSLACPGAATPSPFAPSAGVVSLTVCGDGLVRGNEPCDDGNTDGGDGCSAACAVEYGWFCEGPAGGPSACGATCGDGLLGAGAETCDDGDASSGDGCSPTCAPEPGWTCAPNPNRDGTPANPDSLCAATCGDGRIAVGAETCDDGDASDGDGCSATCVPEAGWSCEANPQSQGTPAAPDSLCAATCGDGDVAVGAETCDDGDAAGGDGCSASCALERGWVCATPGEACAPGPCGDGVRPLGTDGCDDGNEASGDGCSATCRIEPGYSCTHTAIDGDGAPDSACASTCGDGRLAPGVEACDDGGADPGDGCDAGCAVEDGWTCSDVPDATSACAEICGDGRIVGDEACDDRNTNEHDGCAPDCGAIEHGWDCEGEPSVCATTCGDSLIGADAEVCDDGNVEVGDGCDCASVEVGWSCGDPPAEPSVCEPDCGDGYLRGVEGCDDGNVLDDDGCSADCRNERGWICRQEEEDGRSICRRDTDEDGVLDDGDDSGDPFDNPCDPNRTSGCDDNCPDLANPDQTIPIGDEATFLCPPWLGERTQGGGGGCGSGATPTALALVALVMLALRRGRAVFAAGAAFLCAVAANTSGPSMARAQGVDPRLLDPSLSPLSLVGVESSATPGHLRPWGSVLLNIADDELVTRVSPDATEHGPLTDRTVLTLAAGLGLLDVLDVAIGVPVHATSLGTAASIAPSAAPDRPRLSGEAVGLGDLRLSVRGRLVGPRWGESGVGLALVGDLTLPTATDSPFMGDEGFTLLPRLVVDYRQVDGLIVALNLGYRMRPEARVDDLEIGDELRLGLGAELPVGFHGIAFTGELAMAVGFGDSALDDGGVAGRELPVEALGGLRWRSQDGWVVGGSAGAGLTEGYGAPDFRVVLGVSYNAPPPAPSREPLVKARTRRDTWDEPEPEVSKSERAAAPLPPERFDAIAAADPDPDGDGVPLPGDQCPTEREDVDGFMDSDGCPDPDNDEDGVLDAADRCPTEKEKVNGNQDDDGCPDEDIPAVVELGPMLHIKDRILFKSGSAELLDSDKLVIEQVAVLIGSTPDVARFRIEGHTDDRGDREFNVDLAERRAWAVLAYLVEQGVARERLFAKGFGPTKPIASNATDAGRAKNRRVEFHVIKPGEPTEGLIPANTKKPRVFDTPGEAPGGGR